jgi:hypothetical protein
MPTTEADTINADLLAFDDHAEQIFAMAEGSPNGSVQHPRIR